MGVRNLFKLEDAFFAKQVDDFLGNYDDCDFVNFEESFERCCQVAYN